MPQVDKENFNYSLVWKYYYMIANPITTKIIIPNFKQVEQCL
jgi:hypothetical protein